MNKAFVRTNEDKGIKRGNEKTVGKKKGEKRNKTKKKKKK